jgi:aminoglycoside phosphotransferase (APT) family kinase protein
MHLKKVRRMSDTLHENGFSISADLVSRLMALQFPHLADLPLRPVHGGGTDNVMFRLGDDLAVRLPQRPEAAGQIEKEVRFLPVLAPHLPLAIPEPVHCGTSCDLFPYPWSVCRWIDGDNAFVRPISDLPSAAQSLGRFVHALHSIDAAGAPAPGDHNFHRGVALQTRDEATRRCLAQLQGQVDTGTMVDIWTLALDLPLWNRPPVWVHGDIHVGNLIVREGNLAAVIDFGGLAAGDPACDLMIAWTLLTPETRPLFRAQINVDDETWLRGRAWALSVAAIALPYYLNRNPLLVSISYHAMEQALLDFTANG